MYFKYIPGIWSMVISFFIVMMQGLFSVIYYRVRGAKLFGLSMLFLGGWIVCKGLSILSADFYTQNFWENATFCLYTALHTIWFIMVLQFGGKREWLKSKTLILLLILPILSMILVWTKHFSGLVYYGFSIDAGVRLPATSRSFAWVFLLNPIYTYTLDAIAMILVFQKSLFYKSIYGMKMSSFLLGPVISICPSLLYLMSFWLTKGYDITGVFLSVASVLAAAGGYHLFVSAPIARGAAVDNINVAILVINNYGNIADVNHAAQLMFEKNKRSLLGMSAVSVLSSLSRELCDLQNGDSTEILLEENAGARKYLRAQRMPITSKKGVDAGYVVLISDITEMRMEQQRTLQQTTAVVASREREKLARDLHDNLAQVLASISMQAQGICNELKYEETEKVYRDLSRLVDISQTAHREIRDYIHSVREAQSVEKDPFAVTRETLEEFHRQTGIAVSENITGANVVSRLNNRARVNLYYILKEALNNVRKHATGAKQVALTMRQTKDALWIFLRDDGCGFDPDISIENHFGLNIMRERAAEMGAELSIESKPGKGTQIQLFLPLE